MPNYKKDGRLAAQPKGSEPMIKILHDAVVLGLYVLALIVLAAVISNLLIAQIKNVIDNIRR